MAKINVVSQADPTAEPHEINLSGPVRATPVQAVEGVKLTAAEKKKAATAAAKAGNETWAETFYVMADPPGGIVDEFLTAASGSGTRTVWSQVSLLSFLRSIMVDEDNAARFDDLARDPKRMLNTRAMVAVVNQLIPLYTHFPTGAPGA